MRIVFYRMTGRCSTGAERDGGALYHAIRVPEGGIDGWERAICGAKPGDRGNGWSDYAGDRATCPRCLKKLEGR